MHQVQGPTEGVLRAEAKPNCRADERPRTAPISEQPPGSRRHDGRRPSTVRPTVAQGEPQAAARKPKASRAPNRQRFNQQKLKRSDGSPAERQRLKANNKQEKDKRTRATQTQARAERQRRPGPHREEPTANRPTQTSRERPGGPYHEVPTKESRGRHQGDAREN